MVGAVGRGGLITIWLRWVSGCGVRWMGMGVRGAVAILGRVARLGKVGPERGEDFLEWGKSN